MKTLIVLGLSSLILSMDVEASLSSNRPEVRPDPLISAQVSSGTIHEETYASQNQLARVYIDLGVHAPIGRHGRIDLYFGGPSHYYGYPSHFRYRHHRPYYRRDNHHYKPYYRHHYRPYPHHWKRHHYRQYDHRGRHYGPARRHGQW